jgi:hypothetical protein
LTELNHTDTLIGDEVSAAHGVHADSSRGTWTERHPPRLTHWFLQVKGIFTGALRVFADPPFSPAEGGEEGDLPADSLNAWEPGCTRSGPCLCKG